MFVQEISSASVLPLPSSEVTNFCLLSPADFILDTVSIDYHSSESEVESTERVNRIVALWEKSKLSKLGSSDRSSRANSSAGIKGNHVANYRSAAPFFTAFPVLIDRSFK
jgi:hypothetical protein